MSQPKILGGYILFARKTLSSGIMEKPPLYMKLWIWMLLQASFKDHGNLKRGQFFTSLERMRNAMSYKAGYRTVRPTIKEIRSATKFLTKVRMVGTMKVTHGMVITVLNYDYYQNWQNYEGHNEGTHAGHTQGTILRMNGCNKGKEYKLASGNSDEDLAAELVEFYKAEICPFAGDKKRAIKNTAKKIRSFGFDDLKQAVSNYKTSITDNSGKLCDRQYRKRAANFFGVNEPFCEDFLPDSFDTANNPHHAPQSTGSPLLDSYHANAS